MLCVEALRLEQSPGRYIYSFGIDGKEVPKFASVSRARRADEDISLIGYQRPEVQKHIAQIREYIDSQGAMVPNAIVLAFAEGATFTPYVRRSRSARSLGGAEAGTLEIPVARAGEEKIGFVVDGQQRLAAIREAERNSFPVFAVAFEARTDEEQREQFLLVNSTKPLPKGLIHELLPGTQGHLPPHLEKRKLPAELLAHLNHTQGSPLEGAIRTATNPTGRIADNSMLRVLETSLSDGVLWEIAQVEEGEGAVVEMCKVLQAFWAAVREVWEDIWELKPRQSRLLHGAGVVTLAYLMEEMIVRYQGEPWPPKAYFVGQLELIRDDFKWTDGWWDFGGDVRRRWDEIQNVNKDVMMLMNHMTRVYRLASRPQRRDRSARAVGGAVSPSSQRGPACELATGPVATA